jgi:alkyl hydroperoxide reductase subunit AhpF
MVTFFKYEPFKPNLLGGIDMGSPPGDERSIFRSEMEKVTGPLKIVLIAPEAKSEPCEEMSAIMEDVCKTNQNITFVTYKEGSEDLPSFVPPVELYPTVLILDSEGKEHGTRFVGAPSGRILHTICLMAQLITSGSSGLDEAMLSRVKALPSNEIRVLATPQAPNIEGTMDAMARFAYASDNIRTSIIEIIQFPDLAERYRVIDMPKTLSNEDLKYTGAFTLEEAIQILENRIGDQES